MPYTKHIFFTSAFSWSLLGFTRGVQTYDYIHKKKSQFGTENKDAYLYSIRIGHGIIGAFVYAVPIFVTITLPKEIYRLEVNIRGLEEEKKTPYYNELL